MAFVGSLLGAGQGTGFEAQGTDIQKPTTTGQATDAYTNAQGALAQQQAFLQALQAQDGINNQSNVYNQLQGVANGTGPNAAQAMLNQQTGQNVANTAALMAGTRGSSANAGMIARQAGQQGAATQQNAVGQGAALQAQQSMNAMNSMGNIANQQVGQQATATAGLNSAAQGLQQNILGGIASQNNAAVGMQSNINNTNNSSAIQNSKAQQGLLGGALGGAGSMFAQGGMVEDNKPRALAFSDGGGVPMVSAPVMSTTSAPSAGPQSAAGQFLSGMGRNINMGMPSIGSIQGNETQGSGGINLGMQNLVSKAGNAVKGAFKSAPSTQMPGVVNVADLPAQSLEVGGQFGAMEPGEAAGGGAMTPTAVEGAGADASAAEGAEGAAAAGEGAEGASSASELIAALAFGGQAPKVPMDTSKSAKNLKSGGKVPGKAKYKGNNYKNDTVPAMLSPGEVVLPKDVMESKDPVGNAAKFVHAVLMKKRLNG